MNDDLGPLPEVCPRHDIVARARIRFQALFSEWKNHYELTTSEFLQILSGELDWQLRCCVSDERRREKEKQGDGHDSNR